MGRQKTNTATRANATAKRLGALERVDWTDVDEPDLAIIKALGYYSVFMDYKQARKWTFEWAKQNEPKRADLVKQTELSAFATIGKFARLDLLGAPISDNARGTLRQFVQSLQPKRADATSERVSPIVYIERQASDTICDLQKQLDVLISSLPKRGKSKFEWDISIPKSFTAKHLSVVRSVFQPTLNELLDFDDDEQIREGWGWLSKHQRAILVESLQELMGILRDKQEAKKAPRKPRKKKAISAEKRVSKVQFQKSCEKLGIRSHQPTKILDSQRVLLYDTKYQKVTLLESLDGGFSVSGTTIKNIDESKSTCKIVSNRKHDRGLRDKYVKSTVQSMAKAGIRAVRKTINSIPTKESKVTGRLGKTTIILGVY